MEQLLILLKTTAEAMAVLFAIILCAGALILSAMSLSGTWLVFTAAVILSLLLESSFPWWWISGAFLMVCMIVEAVEFGAGYLGVKKRGGSRHAGVMAALGGLSGMLIGGLLIPAPIIGNIIGLLVGSFMGAYIVEKKRLNNGNNARKIAAGAVIARLSVLMLKVIVTLGMITVLIIGML